MNTFADHSLDCAPDASRPVLQAAIDAFGFLPKLVTRMPSSPTMTGPLLTGPGRLKQRYTMRYI